MSLEQQRPRACRSTASTVHSAASTVHSAAPTVPGYRLTDVLGRGASATVWRAEPIRGGDQIAIKVVRAGPLAERELAVLAAVRHPHVATLHEVVALDDGRLALVIDLLDGGTLAQVVAARGRLQPGEVVTCLAPLAQALSDLHARGVQHGDLAPGNVLLDRAGRPVLADLGTVRVTGESRVESYGTPGYVDPVVLTGGSASPASDVHGLGALAWFALTGAPPPGVPSRGPLAGLVAPHVPTALVDLVEAAVDPDRARRPSADEFARRLHEAAVAVPIWRRGLAPADGGLTHRVDAAVRGAALAADARARHRRVRPPARFAVARWGAAVALAVGAVLAVVALLGAGGSGRRPSLAQAPAAPSRVSSVSAARTPSAQDAAVPADRLGLATAREVVARASRQRALALSTARGSTGMAPGSAADRADRDAVRALATAGLRYRGLRLTPRSVQVRSRQPGRAVLDVVVDTSAYAVVDRRGRVLRRVSAAPGGRSLLEVVRTPQGWQIAAVGGYS